jgi:glycosyltransferase involved in cell wall biosynthesis
MKIGIDCRIYSSKFTGIGRYVYELVHRISKLDQTNQYVLFFNDAEFNEFTSPANNFKKVLVDAPIYSFKEQTSFLKILKKENLDLMHFTHFNAPIFYNKPSVVTIHDLTLSFFPGKKKRSLLHRIGYYLTLRAAVKKATKVITISENSKKDLVKITKTPEDKISVIYQGVGEEFKAIKDKKRIEKTLKKYKIKSPFLLYTGVWRSHKNIPNLVKAFHQIRSKYDMKNLGLVLTGKEDPFYPEVKETIQNLNENKNIIRPGLVSEGELLDLYTSAEVYVFPSLYEGFGLPPLEAMSCETPVAASNVSSIPEICGKGNVVYFDPTKVEDMTQNIYTLLKNNSLQLRLVKNGLKRAKKFTWKQMAQSTYNLYRSCLSN